VIIVPRDRPSLMGGFEQQLDGTGIEIVHDRRQAERRWRAGRRTEDRRRANRRSHHRVVAYMFGCTIARVEHPPAGG
jgi:hypothetical protein